MSIANNLLLSILESGTPEDLLAVDTKMLSKEKELPAFDFATQYYLSYKKLPSASLVRTRFQLEQIEGDLNFWKEEFSNMRFSLIYETSINQINKDIYEGKVSKAKEKLTKLAHDVQSIGVEEDTYARNGALNALLDALITRRSQSGIIGIPTGWPTIDELTMGFIEKNIYVLSARLKIGKTMCIAYMAEMAYRAGKKVLVVSMEMGREEYFTRVMSLVTRISAHQLFRGQISTIAEEHLREIINQDTRENSYIFQEGTLKATLAEIAFKILTERPDVVFIDGAYLIRIPGGQKMPVWERATEIVSQLKIMAGRYNVPIVATYQFNREATKRAIAGAENIHHSDAIGQIATVVLGLFDVADIQGQKRLEVIANRNGPCGHAIINWDWNNANFSEIEGFNENSLHMENEEDINRGEGESPLEV